MRAATLLGYELRRIALTRHQNDLSPAAEAFLWLGGALRFEAECTRLGLAWTYDGKDTLISVRKVGA